MIVTLNNQKTVEISFEQFIDMTDKEWAYFLDSDYGEGVNDPFFGSQIEEIPTKFFDLDEEL